MTAAAASPPLPSASDRTRVLVVDDSVVVRGLVSRWLSESGKFEVVGTASNGRIAINRMNEVEPDIVLLDLDMPELDGLSALPQLLAKRPTASIVVVSTLSQRNADISLRCLSLGAIDYLPKPESHRDVSTSVTFRAELLAKLEALASRHGRKVAVPARPASPRPPQLRGQIVPPRCLMIGASTGGPRAILKLVTNLGLALQRVPVLVVQHMPPIFTTVFAEQLRAHAGVMAREAEHNERLVPGQIYVAPGGRHMGLARSDGHTVIRLDDGPPINFCRPAVDFLFRDAATVFGGSALAVVLTGMGSDGVQGARALVESGAAVLAQDEATSTVWGMPGSIARAGLAQEVLPLDELGPAVKKLVMGSGP